MAQDLYETISHAIQQAFEAQEVSPLEAIGVVELVKADLIASIADTAEEEGDGEEGEEGDEEAE